MSHNIELRCMKCGAQSDTSEFRVEDTRESFDDGDGMTNYLGNFTITCKCGARQEIEGG